MNMQKNYNTAVSYWLFIIIGIAILASPIMNIIKHGSSASLNPLWFGLLVCCLLIFMIINIKYKIQQSILKIYYGVPFFPVALDINNIQTIKKTKSLLASPAASITQRIEIDYGSYQSIVISPKNSHEFVKDLLKINPSIKTNVI